MILSLKEIHERGLKIFTNRGVSNSKANELMDILIKSHQLGYGSHGIGRIPMYANELEEGNIIADQEATIEKEGPCTALINGNWSLGPLVVKRGIELAIQKAKQLGVSIVSFKNTPDIARLGAYVEIAAEKKMIALLFVNDAGGSPAVCPTGSSEAFFSTNPIAAGIPTNKDFSIIIDLSTAVVAIGKLRQAISFKRDIPEGWLIEKDGSSCLEPRNFFKETNSAALLPLGGLLSGHKGYALSLLVDIMAGALSGSGTSGKKSNYREQNGVTAIVINPQFFCDENDFEKEVGELIDRLKSLPTLTDLDKVKIPGERHCNVSSDEGQKVEIDPETWIKLLALES